MPVVGFLITSSNISHAVLSFALPLLHVSTGTCTGRRVVCTSVPTNVGLIPPFFSQIKRAIISRF